MSPSADKEQPNLLVISDGHRGYKKSHFSTFEPELEKHMGKYGHVVFNGDMFELFYPDEDSKISKQERGYHGIIKRAINDNVDWLKTFLKNHPQTKVHFVLGNHENIKKFRSRLDKLAEKFDNFEWDAEAIRIADGLFLHSDLQMSSKSDASRGTYRLRDAAFPKAWRLIHKTVYKPGETVLKWLSQPEHATRIVSDELKRHAALGDMHYLHEGKREPLTVDSLKEIKHVFFGHTHVKFESIERDGVHYHNTGSFMERSMQKLSDSGMQEAELEGGRLVNVRLLGRPPAQSAVAR